MLWVSSRAGGGNFSSGRFAGMVPGRRVQLFADKTEAASKAAALLNRG